MTILRYLAAVAFLLSLSSQARADDDFEVAANTCTPTSTTVDNAGYIMSTSVRHSASATGTIEFYCMLPRDVTEIYAIGALTSNHDGGTGNYRIRCI